MGLKKVSGKGVHVADLARYYNKSVDNSTLIDSEN